MTTTTHNRPPEKPQPSYDWKKLLPDMVSCKNPRKINWTEHQHWEGQGYRNIPKLPAETRTYLLSMISDREAKNHPLTSPEKAKIAATLLVMETFGRYAKKLDKTQQEFRERAFLHAVANIPFSCVDAAFLEWSSTQAEYPTPAEIKELAEDHFRTLKYELKNLGKLLENIGKPVQKIEVQQVSPQIEEQQAKAFSEMSLLLTKSLSIQHTR